MHTDRRCVPQVKKLHIIISIIIIMNDSYYYYITPTAYYYITLIGVTGRFGVGNGSTLN